MQEDDSFSLLFTFALNTSSGRSKKIRRDWSWMKSISFCSVLKKLIYWVKI